MDGIQGNPNYRNFGTLPVIYKSIINFYLYLTLTIHFIQNNLHLESESNRYQLVAIDSHFSLIKVTTSF
jgi:hypothetical protein